MTNIGQTDGNLKELEAGTAGKGNPSILSAPEQLLILWGSLSNIAVDTCIPIEEDSTDFSKLVFATCVVSRLSTSEIDSDLLSTIIAGLEEFFIL